MAVYKQAKSKYWWYKFTWNGEADSGEHEADQ